MNFLILNRTGQLPADNWYQIEVSGEHYNPAAGLVQVIDAPALESIVNRFSQAAQAPNFAGLLIDQDHFSLDPTKSTEAFGWVKELRNRDGQLEGRIEWSDLGKPAVESGRFKFFSTVYSRADVEKIGERPVKNGVLRPAVRPLALDRLAVTNDPNNKGGKPISNRDCGEKTQPTQTMKNLLKKMGLSEDASEDAALAAYTVIANRATKAEGDLATAHTELGTLREAVVGADLEKYKNRIKPENVAKVRAQLIANRAGTLELLESLAEPAAAPAAVPPPITNRASARTPAALADEATKADAADAEVRAYKIANRCSYEEAHAAVRRLKPALFS